MRITASTVDRSTTELGQLRRAGRQLSHAAAHELDGDLPSRQIAVLERAAWAVAAPAGWTDEEAGVLCRLLGRLTHDLSGTRQAPSPAPG